MSKEKELQEQLDALTQQRKIMSGAMKGLASAYCNLEQDNRKMIEELERLQNKDHITWSDILFIINKYKDV